MRKERDFLGTREIPRDALYGIHAVRAKENFPDDSGFSLEWYKSLGLVKQAYFIALRKFYQALADEGINDVPGIPQIEDKIIDAMEASAREVSEGLYFEDFIVPGISGGAGTSINLNVCEIIANAALKKLDRKPGDYDLIDPILHANVFQSTNDAVPSALHVAVMRQLQVIESSINDLRAGIEVKESVYRNLVRPGYTQLQEAVPTSWGKLFGSYSEALSRDWWRISRCLERMKVVNLGGGAVGTGLGVPRFIIHEVVPILHQLTGLPVTRSENLPDATSNLDSLVEVHGMVKALAVNLEKMSADLRLLASDLGKQGLVIPKRQAGSSIMPGKVNPVIPEFTISAAHKVYANDGLITSLAAQGQLELNAYLPVIGHSILESLRLLISACRVTQVFLVDGLSLDKPDDPAPVHTRPVVATALIPFLGYHKAAEIAQLMKAEHLDIYVACDRLGVLDPERLKEILQPENLLRLGYSVRESGPDEKR